MLLNNVIAAEMTSGRNVICVAEHVKYWDYLGWTDPFGDSQFQTRQNQYAAHFGDSQIWTPDVIVNGATRTNSLTSTNNAINSYLGGSTATAGISLELLSDVNAATLSVGYSLSGTYTGATKLVIAFTENNLVTNITSGENGGTTPTESGVSRKFIVQTISGPTGTVDITPPTSCVRANCSIVAFLQNQTTMAMLGGTNGIKLATVGASEIEPSISMNFYPNPASQEIMFNISNPVFKGDAIVNIVDLSGRIVYTENITVDGNFSKTINISNFSKGLYSMNMIIDNKSFNKKFVVE